MNRQEAVEQVVELLENNNVAENFEGVDVSLNCSLDEYGFIYSEKNELAIFVNEYHNLDFFKISKEDLTEGYADPFRNGSWAASKKYLFCDFNQCENIKEALRNIVQFVTDFHHYFGLENAFLASPYYNRGYSVEDTDKLLSDLEKCINY